MKKKIVSATALITLFIMGFSTAYAKITVVSVKGKAAYKTGRQWKPLKKNMQLEKGTKISTGIRSYVHLNLNGNNLKIRPLSMIKVYENTRSKSRIRTRIGLRRGSIRARVAKSRRIKTIFKVSTPVATSSVRGTIEDVSYGPVQGMRVRVVEGVIQGENRKGIKRLISGKMEYHQKPGEAEVKPLLAKVRGKAIAVIFDPNITSDEKDYHDIFGEELINNHEGADDYIKNKLQNAALVHIVPTFEK